ncbi:hypothetical protein [Streptomyces griseoviridis]|uniref:hypothetical protein n=1 Tax=Streptomyces griseoviridis TaxID=45398 RepID=UPI003F56E083
MTYDRLVCANCAAPVSEGRCPVCRANRERLPPASGPPTTRCSAPPWRSRAPKDTSSPDASPRAATAGSATTG